MPFDYRCFRCRKPFKRPRRTKGDLQFCSRRCSAIHYNSTQKSRAIKISKTIKRHWRENRSKMLAGLHRRDYTKTRETVKKLWQNKSFRKRIAAARKKSGYPRDPLVPLRALMRSFCKNCVRRCLRALNTAKETTTIELLGYSPELLRIHIERLFKPGMAWSNYGKWEIDHKRPICSFPITTAIEEINKLSNLQPLWKEDNRRKNGKL